MPLFTYIVSYKGSDYVAQGSHSNFTGFASTWSANIPKSALRTMTQSQREYLAKHAWDGSFEPVSGLTHVWRKVIHVQGSDCVITAIQTDR